MKMNTFPSGIIDHECDLGGKSCHKWCDVEEPEITLEEINKYYYAKDENGSEVPIY